MTEIETSILYLIIAILTTENVLTTCNAIGNIDRIPPQYTKYFNEDNKIFNDNVKKIIHSVEVIHQDDDATNMYETTANAAHKNRDTLDQLLFDGTLLDEMQTQQSNTPDGYSIVVKKSVVKRRGSNGKLNSKEFGKSVMNTEDSQILTQTNQMGNDGVQPLINYSQQMSGLPGNFHKTVQTTTTLTGGNTSNELNGIQSLNLITQSNGVPIITSSNSNNYYENKGTLKSYPMVEDHKTLDVDGTTGQEISILKPEDSFKRMKTEIVTNRDSNNGDNLGDLKGNNIISTISSSAGYNQLTKSPLQLNPMSEHMQTNSMSTMMNRDDSNGVTGQIIPSGNPVKGAFYQIPTMGIISNTNKNNYDSGNLLTEFSSKKQNDNKELDVQSNSIGETILKPSDIVMPTMSITSTENGNNYDNGNVLTDYLSKKQNNGLLSTSQINYDLPSKTIQDLSRKPDSFRQWHIGIVPQGQSNDENQDRWNMMGFNTNNKMSSLNSEKNFNYQNMNYKQMTDNGFDAAIDDYIWLPMMSTSDDGYHLNSNVLQENKKLKKKIQNGKTKKVLVGNNSHETKKGKKKKGLHIKKVHKGKKHPCRCRLKKQKLDKRSSDSSSDSENDSNDSDFIKINNIPIDRLEENGKSLIGGLQTYKNIKNMPAGKPILYSIVDMDQQPPPPMPYMGMNLLPRPPPNAFESFDEQGKTIYGQERFTDLGTDSSTDQMTNTDSLYIPNSPRILFQPPGPVGQMKSFNMFSRYGMPPPSRLSADKGPPLLPPFMSWEEYGNSFIPNYLERLSPPPNDLTNDQNTDALKTKTTTVNLQSSNTIGSTDGSHDLGYTEIIETTKKSDGDDLPEVHREVRTELDNPNANGYAYAYSYSN